MPDLGIFGKDLTSGQWRQLEPADTATDSNGNPIAPPFEFDTIVDAAGFGDYTDIQSAIDGGGINIFVRNGTYNITTQIEIDQTDAVKKLVGESREGVVVQSSDTSNHIFNISGLSVSTTGTFTFTANSTTVTGVGTLFSTHGVAAGDFIIGAPSTVHDVRGYKIASVGGETTLTLAGDYRYSFVTLGGLGTRIFRPVKDLTISNMTLFKSGNSGGTKYCINAQYCSNLTLTGIHFKSGFDGQSNHHVTISVSTGIRALRNEFSAANSGSVTGGVSCSYSGDIRYEYNTLRGANDTGFLRLFASICSHISVKGNIAEFTDIQLDASAAFAISGNMVSSGRIYARNIFAGQSRAEISGNVLSRSGILVDGQTGQGIVVDGNTVMNSLGTGIQVDSVGGTISNNVVQYSTFSGIFLAGGGGGTPAIVSGNYCAFNTLAGIASSTGVFATFIIGNISSANGTYGVYILAGSGTRVENNELAVNGTSMILDVGTNTRFFMNRDSAAKSFVGLGSQGVTGVALLSTTSGIDAFVVGTTNLYTVPTGKTVMVDHVEVELTAASGITVAGDGGVGVAAGEDDIIASTTLTGITTTGVHTKLEHKNGAAIATSTQVIKWGNDIAPTGTSGTYRIRLYGTEY